MSFTPGSPNGPPVHAMTPFSLRKATLKYLGALALIAVLSIGTHMVIASVVTEQGRAAQVINLAGKQRMLSQRIAEDALELSTADEEQRGPLLKRMRDDTDQMERAHKVLRDGDITLGIAPPSTTALRAIYEQQPFSVDQRVDDFVAKVRMYGEDHAAANQKQQLREILYTARTPLLRALDAAVTQYQTDSDRAISRLQIVLLGVVALMLCTLLGEALLIFKPMFAHLKSSHLALIEAAHMDPLTGSMNRRHFLEIGEEEWLRCVALPSHLSVIVLDIDNFKSINDQFGHMIGDHAIQNVVRLILANVRAGDHVGRMGGEEFAVILPTTGESPALAIAEQIRRAIDDTPFVYPGGSLHLTVSIGVAQWSKADDSVLATIDRADQALYLAKRGGRNRVKMWSISV